MVSWSHTAIRWEYTYGHSSHTRQEKIYKLSVHLPAQPMPIAPLP